MERFTENILLGYTPQRSFEISMKISDTNSDTDFSDVFGGPPRRFSIQETRRSYSFRETRVESEEDTVLPRNPWSGLDEKLVFGEEGVSRSPYRSDDFFDDIFKGDEVKSRRTSRDFFASSPSMRILSPSRPLPHKAEPFSPSFPAQFSLPAKLTKATDFPLFGSTNRSPYKNKDDSSNGISCEQTPNAAPSRFASQATEVQVDERDDRPFYRKSNLSREVSHSHQESSYEGKTDKKDVDAKSKEVPLNSGQFHFSIYKWAGSGGQLSMPLGGQNKLGFKERFKTERCSSSNGRIESDSIDRHLPTVEEHIISLHTESVSLKISNGKHEESSKGKKTESCSDVKEAQVAIPEPKFFGSERHAIPQGEDISRKKTEESHTKRETTVYDKSKKETNVNKGQAPKTKLKSLHAQLSDENQVQGEGNAIEGKEKKAKITNIANNDANLSTSAKKTDAERSISNTSEATNVNLQSSVINSGDAFGSSSAKGKVREFVKIFNQETSAKPKTNFSSQSSRWNGMNINETENGMSSVVNKSEKVHKLSKVPDTCCREDDNFNENEVKQESHFKNLAHENSGLSTNEKNASTFSDSLPTDYDNKFESRDESFYEYFLVEELTEVEDKKLQTSGDSEDIKASNAKIQQWSNGRKGNIHSLLSTLQLVLWRESGWKPVPLVDLIEGSAVKRAYQRALLCLHPDKLQQKGSASHQKYIAEQVFEILQEAWDHFNSLCAI